MIQKYLLPFFILVLFSSCYTLKPDSSSVSSPNHNSKIEVTSPKFVKKQNPIGITLQIATPLVAGAAMYQFAPSIVRYQDGAETKSFQPANAIVGVLGMLALNKLLNYSLGYNKVKSMPPQDVHKWMTKAKLNSKYNYIAETEGYKIQMIPKDQETNYTIQSVQDVFYYKAFFPLASSENIGNMLSSGTQMLSHEDLPKMINYYPNHTAVYPAKVKYIETSRTYDELWQRIAQYDDVKVNRELLASNLIILERQYTNYLTKFNSGKYNSKIEAKLLEIDNASFAEFAIINTKDAYRNYIAKFEKPHNKDEALKRIKDIEDEEIRIAERKKREEMERIERERIATKKRNEEQHRQALLEMNNSYKIAINLNSINDLYNFYLNYQNSKLENASIYATNAYNRAISINQDNATKFNSEVEFSSGRTLVKIILKSKNGRPLFNEAKSLYNFMDKLFSESWVLLGGWSNEDKLFTAINEPVTFFDKIVINAQWYREGTMRADILEYKRNTGFPAFKNNLNSFAHSIGANVEYVEYLGSYSDDMAKRERERQSYERYKQEECNKCTVNWNKTTDPTIEDGFFGKSYASGRMEMKNGDSYSWDYDSKGFRVNNGLLNADDYYNNFNLMVNALVERCKEKKCK